MGNPECSSPLCTRPRRSLNPRGWSGYLCARCRACVWAEANPERHNATQKRNSAIRRQRAREFVQSYKLEHGCADCGYAEHVEALQFDHLRDKSFLISKSYARSMSVLRAEMDKCEVVCANCHAIRTARRRKEAGDGQPIHEPVSG